MSVEVANETEWSIDPKQFSDLGAFVLDQMRVSPGADLTITFVDPQTIADLHERWMGLIGPTDVMSFPMDELRPGKDGALTPAGILGDIVLCPDVAIQQAHASGHSGIEEMLLLTAHGILHLLGFDHMEPEQERAMFDLQRQLMLLFIAARGTAVHEIVLPEGAEDMLASYYRDHPELPRAGSEKFIHSGASDGPTQGLSGEPEEDDAEVQSDEQINFEQLKANDERFGLPQNDWVGRPESEPEHDNGSDDASNTSPYSEK